MFFECGNIYFIYKQKSVPVDYNSLSGLNFQQLETLLELVKPQEHVVKKTSLVLNLQYAVKKCKSIHHASI